METRLVCRDDIASLAALHANSFGAACWSVQAIADSLALSTTIGFMVCEGAKNLGFILCQIIADEAEILTLCTAPTARRWGVGTKLVQHILQTAQARGVRKIFLEVAVDNVAARSLYEKNGFFATGMRKDYYVRAGQTVDAVLLTWEKI